MNVYDLHVQQVDFQNVPAHHVLRQLTRRFGSEILIDTIKRFEERDQQSTQDREQFGQGYEFVMQ